MLKVVIMKGHHRIFGKWKCVAFTVPWSANLDKVPLLSRDAVLFGCKIISKHQKSVNIFFNDFKASEICGNVCPCFQKPKNLWKSF